MSFRIVPEVFDKLPELYIGALVVKGIDNTKDYPQVTEFLDECVQNLHREMCIRDSSGSASSSPATASPVISPSDSPSATGSSWATLCHS